MISVGDLLAYLKLRDEMSPAIEDATKNLDRFTGQANVTAYQLTVLGRGLREAGALATGLFTVPILAAAEGTIKFGSEFETQMTRVSTLAGASMEEVNSLRQSVLDLGPATGIGPAKLAEGLFVLESFGQKGAVAMDTLKVSAEMSALGMGSTAENARALTGAIFAYRNQNLSAAEAGDILTKTVQLGNMKINELTPALARVNPIAAAMGVSFQDVAASIATFTHAGVDSAMAATGIRAVLNSILTDSAKTEKGFAALAKATGDNTITMANFRKEMAENGLTAAMIQLTDNVTKAGDAGVTAMGQIIPNIRGLTEALAVYKTNGGMVVNVLGQLKDAHGTIGKSTEELHKTWAFQWAQMQAEVEKMFISLGDAGLMDIFKQLLAFIKDDLFPILKTLTTWFAEQPGWVKKTELAVAGFLAILGPGLIVMGQFAMAVGNIARGFQLLQQGGAVASGASSIIAFLSNPWVLGGAVVIGGIALAIYEYNKNMAMVKPVAPTTVTFLAGLKDANGNLAVTAEQAKKASEGLGELQNGFSTTIPSMAGHAVAASTASAATQTLLQKVKALSDEQRHAIDIDKAQGMTITQIAKDTNIAADVIGVYERQTAKSSAVRIKALNDEVAYIDANEKSTGKFQQTLGKLMFGYDYTGKMAQGFHQILTVGMQTVATAGDGISNLKDRVEALQRAGQFMSAFWAQTGVVFATLPNVTSNLETFNKKMDDTAKKRVDDYGKSLSILSTEFTKLGQISGGALGDVLKNFGSMVVLLETAHKLTQQIGGADSNTNQEKIGGNFGPLSVMFSDVASNAQKGAAAVATAAAIYQGANAVWDATAAHATAAGNALGGMAAGAQAGAAFGPWGMAIGAAAGLVVGIIRGKPDWAKAADEVANDFGVKISDKLAKTIAEEAKKDFGGSMQASAISHLADIISAGGGLTSKNLEQMTARLRDVFSMIETHQMTVTQGTKTLDDNWGAFVQAATDGNGRISESLKEIIRLNDTFGTQSKAIADWQKGQGGAALEGFVAVAGSLADLIPGYDELKKAVDSAAPGSKELALALHDQAKEAANSKGALSDIGIQAIASFTAAVASGMSMSEAMSKIHPALQNLKKSYEDLGISTDNVALKNLLLQDTIISGNPNLMNAIQGLSGEMVALDNLGLMNVDTFGAMERTGMEMYSRLLNAAIDATGGYDEMTGAVKDIDGATRLALGQMQKYLHDAQTEAEKLGIPLDDNTARLIDQSKKAGIWQTAITPTDKLLGGMQTLIDKVTDLVNTLNNIPKTITTTVTTVHRDVNDDNSPNEREGFAFGTFGTTGSFFKDFGGGTNVRLHGNEAVVRTDQAGAFAASVGGNSSEFADAFESLEAAIEDQTRQFKLSIREAVATR